MPKAKVKTITVTLTEDDLWFITSSISANIPNCADRTPAEAKTADKMSNAYHRVQMK